MRSEAKKTTAPRVIPEKAVTPPALVPVSVEAKEKPMRFELPALDQTIVETFERDWVSISQTMHDGSARAVVVHVMYIERLIKALNGVVDAHPGKGLRPA